MSETPGLVDRLRSAAGWVERQDTPAPDWDGLLTEAADALERRERWRPAWAVHPGEILQEEIRERGMTQMAFAEMIDCAYQHLSRVCCGHVRIEAPFAVKLEKALGVSAELWLNLQQAYDLHKVRSA